MAENKFDKEKISIVSDADVPVSYVPFTGEKCTTYETTGKIGGNAQSAAEV